MLKFFDLWPNCDLVNRFCWLTNSFKQRPICVDWWNQILKILIRFWVIVRTDGRTDRQTILN